MGLDVFYIFGNPGDTPLVGDWDGDGKDEIGIHRNREFYLDSNGNGSWDVGVDEVISFGLTTDTPIIGDWDGDGDDDIGVHRGDLFFLDFQRQPHLGRRGRRLQLRQRRRYAAHREVETTLERIIH